MKNRKKSTRRRIIAGIIGGIMCIAALGTSFYFKANQMEETAYTEFTDYVEHGKVDSIEIALEQDTFTYILKDGSKYKTQNPKYDNFKKDMLDAGVSVKESQALNYSSVLTFMMSAVTLSVMFILLKRVTGGGSPIDTESSSKSDITFQDVAGLKEVKEDLSVLVDFLTKPDKYRKAGAKLPKGAIFYGPPGTGKTLLAKAVAGEANVNFKAVSGADFMEKYVGVGAERVRKLFVWANKHAPCIIFIDEIDAIGGKRRSSDQEKRQTLDALLNEMDGFHAGNGIIVIAATNRLQDLDPALVRPGRFDSHFAVPLPLTAADRREVIDIYAKGKTFADDVDFDVMAKETLGFTPADIEVILNEATILAVKDGNGIITKQFLDDALYKKIMKGHAKKDLERREEEIKLTAWHEAGHALASIMLGQEVTKVTIVPSTSGAGGATFHHEEKITLYSRTDIENKLKILYAGRAAESLLVTDSNITTGAASDIKEATHIIYSMITEYGMSSFGMIALNELGADKRSVIKEAKAISDKQYMESLALLKNHMGKLKSIAALLIEKGTLTGDEVRSIITSI